MYTLLIIIGTILAVGGVIATVICFVALDDDGDYSYKMFWMAFALCASAAACYFMGGFVYG